MQRTGVGLALLLASLGAQAAPITYTYIGNTLATLGADDPRTYAITVSLTFNAALASSLTYGDVAPVSYSISDGWATITDATPNYYSLIRVSTDATGAINKWNILTEAPFADNTQNHISTQETSGVCCSNLISDFTFFCFTVIDPFSCAGRGAYLLNNRGRWSTEVVPLPAAVWLLGSALGVLGWMRRRLLG